ncbi:MAG TPA: AsmA family protein [Candidatus Methylomirabilis sp.]|nr:AsmA family protein [Candidatus Methylomirabilis sp.]
MIRVLKWAGIGIGGILLLGVTAALILPSVVNLERYRVLLASRVGKALGREVTLGGLRVSLWGGIGAEARGIQVAQAQGFGSEPFLAADALRVRLQLLPLFRGHMKVSTAILERPRIRLTHARDGRWSVDDLLKAPAAPAPVRSSADVPRSGKAPLFGGLLLSEVAVRDGEITLFDEAGSKAITLGLTDLDLGLRQASPSGPIDFQSRAQIAGSGAGRFEVSGRISPGEPDGPVVEATFGLRDVETAPWQGLLGDGGIALSGPLSAEVKLSGPLAKVVFSGTLDLKAVAVQAWDAFQKATGDEAAVRFEGRREERGVTLSKLLVTVKDVAVDGSLRIPDLRAPQVTFDATSAMVDLDRLLAPPKAKAAWLGPAPAAAAPPLRQSPSAPGGSGPAAGMAGKAPESGLTAQGRIKIGDLRYQGLLWSAVTIDVRYRGGRLELPDVQADFMNGRLAAKGEVDLRPKTPRVALTSRLTDVATEPVVKALARGSWSLKGVFNGESTLSFTGFSIPAILGSASGSGSVLLKDGRLTDYKPLDRLTEVIGPFLAAQGTPVRLNEFELVAGHYTLDKGVLRTKDLTLTKPEGTVTAGGSLALLDSSLDFDVVAKLGRNTVEAKVTGTTSEPIVVPKLGKFQRRIETEMEKILPGEQGKGLKELFRGLFGK